MDVRCKIEGSEDVVLLWATSSTSLGRGIRMTGICKADILWLRWSPSSVHLDHRLGFWTLKTQTKSVQWFTWSVRTVISLRVGQFEPTIVNADVLNSVRGNHPISFWAFPWSSGVYQFWELIAFRCWKARETTNYWHPASWKSVSVIETLLGESLDRPQ